MKTNRKQIITLAIASTIAATSIILPTPQKVCADGTCGDCYVSGIKGKPVWDNGSQSCKICID